MDLKTFVSQSLTQISEGIKNAQEQAEEAGAWISPFGHGMPRHEQTLELSEGMHAYVHDVEFDVAITVTDDQNAGGAASIKVLGVKLGGNADVKYGNESVTRVQFSIPVVWPVQKRISRELAYKKKVAEQKENVRRGMESLRG